MWREEIGKTRRAEFLGSVVWKRAACKELQSSRLEEGREGCQKTDNLSVPLYRPDSSIYEPHMMEDIMFVRRGEEV